MEQPRVAGTRVWIRHHGAMAATVAEAHAYLVRKGHIDPIVALATDDSTQIVGEPHLPAEIG